MSMYYLKEIELQKNCLKRLLKNKQNNEFKTIGSLMQVKIIAECCNTFDLHLATMILKNGILF